YNCAPGFRRIVTNVQRVWLWIWRNCRRRDRGRPHGHLFADILDFPAREIGEGFGFLLLAPGEFLLVDLCLRTVAAACPGMAQHVAALKVAAVRRFLEDKILRECLRVVTNVEAGD